MAPIPAEEAVPLRCGYCHPDYEGARLGDVLPGYFANRYELLAGPVPPPFVIRFPCRRCGNMLTLRERPEIAA